MQIRTANFHNLPTILEQNYIPVSIDKMYPGYPDLLFLPDLAPKASILTGFRNREICSELFKVLYNKQLSRLSASNLISRIIAHNGNKTKICFVTEEKNKEFSIRRIFNEWLNKEGYYCHEMYTKTVKGK